MSTRPRPTPSCFFDLTPAELTSYCREHDMPRYVPDQLLGWVYDKGVVDPGAMTDIAARHRAVLADTMRFDTGSVLAHQVASDGTQKLLIDWPGANGGDPAGIPLPVRSPGRNRAVECVLIPTERRRTACVSSQVGCPVGCRFCASGMGGLGGNLTRGQIVEQVHRLGRCAGVDRISHVVFMGMGEPLANLRAVTDAIRTLNAPWGLGIGGRRITVSTVGLPEAIRRFADFELPVTLALSLHAPNDDLRRQLIPWAETATIDELLDACRAYFRKSGREITLEYLLLRGVNDRPHHARELAAIARRLRANVNLIRYNEVKGLPYDRPTTRDVHAFQDELRRRDVPCHIRASRGRDIAAACGQLRREATTGR